MCNVQRAMCNVQQVFRFCTVIHTSIISFENSAISGGKNQSFVEFLLHSVAKLVTPSNKIQSHLTTGLRTHDSAMATLGLKEIGKFLWEGREKGLPCWLSQF